MGTIAGLFWREKSLLMKCADRGDNCRLSIVGKDDEGGRRFARLDSESRDRESRGIGAIAT